MWPPRWLRMLCWACCCCCWCSPPAGMLLSRWGRRLSLWAGCWCHSSACGSSAASGSRPCTCFCSSNRGTRVSKDSPQLLAEEPHTQAPPWQQQQQQDQKSPRELSETPPTAPAPLTAVDYWWDGIEQPVGSAARSSCALSVALLILGTHPHCSHPRGRSPSWACWMPNWPTACAECAA